MVALTLLPPGWASAWPRRERRLWDRRSLPLYAVALGAIAMCGVAVASGAFDYDAALVSDAAQPVGFLLVIAWCVRWSGFPNLASLIEATLLGMVIPLVMTFCAAILATADRPLADEALRRADWILFGFDRTALKQFTADHAWFRRASGWIYLSFGFTPHLLFAALFLTGRARLGWTVMTAATLTLAAVIALSWLLPAYGVPPYPYKFADVLDGLRAGTLRRLDATLITGIVTFPSLHAADAVVFAWGFAKLGRVGWPLVGVNVLMIGSAVVTGGHYLVDVFAGCAIAGGAIVLAARLQARLSAVNVSTLPSAS